MNLFIIWVIYDHPRDAPEHFVVRRQFVKTGPIDEEVPLALAPFGVMSTDLPRLVIDQGAYFVKTLAEAREVIPSGLILMARDSQDDPAICEVWY